MECAYTHKWSRDLDRRQGYVATVLMPDMPANHREYAISRDQLGGIHIERMAETEPGAMAYHWKHYAFIRSEHGCGCGQCSGGVYQYGNKFLLPLDRDDAPDWAKPYLKGWQQAKIHKPKKLAAGGCSRPPVVVIHGQVCTR